MPKILIAIIFLLFGIALADSVTVCEDGSCDKTTIQAAINEYIEGDNIIVYSGNYSVININKSNISIIGKNSGGERPVICDDINLRLVDIVDIECPLPEGERANKAAVNIKGKNVTFKGFKIMDDKIMKRVSYGIAITSSGNLIQDNIISDFESCGIIACRSSNNTICKNTISKNSEIGISFVNTSKNKIIGNKLFDNGNNINIDAISASNLISFNNLSKPRRIIAHDSNGSNLWIYNYYETHELCDSNESGYCRNVYTIPGELTTDEHPLSENCVSQKQKNFTCPPHEPPTDDSCNSNGSDIVINGCGLNLSASANRSCAEVGDAINYTINLLNKGSYLENINTYCREINFTKHEDELCTNGRKTYNAIYIIKEEDPIGPFKIVFHATGIGAMCTAEDQFEVKLNRCIPKISVNKTANPSSGCPLDLITFDIKVTNNGKVPLDSVTIVDALPEGMEYNSSSPAGYPEGQDITWNLEEPLLVGKSKEIELVARIIQTTPGILNNTVNATGRHPNGTVKANGSEEVEVIPCNARISIQKNVSPSSGYPLTIVKFIIKVTNTGNQPLNPVTVKDDLPNGLNFVDSTPEGTKDGQNISWTFPQMDPGQSEYIKLLAQIDWFASGNMHNCVEAIGILPNGLNITDIGDKPVKAMNCAIVNVIPIPPPTGLGCCNCCNNCCNCPGNITNNINLNNSGQGIQVVTIGPANVSNLRQKTNNSSNKYNEIKS